MPLYTTPGHISQRTDHQKLHLHHAPQIGFHPTQSSLAFIQDPEMQYIDEESEDKEDEQDFLDKKFIQDNIYLQQRHSRCTRENVDVQFHREQGRPPDSRGRTYFNVARTINTRAKTVD